MPMIVESPEPAAVAVRTATAGPSARLLEAVELRAWEDHYRAARDAGLPELELVRTGAGAALFSPGVEAPALNRAFGFGPVIPLAESLPGAYAARGVPRFLLQVVSDVLDEATERELRSLGYRPHDRSVRLHRDAGDVPWVLTGFEVVRAGAEHRRAFGRICQSSFDLPPSLAPWISALVERPGWDAWVALHEGRPVATAALHVQGKRAWMGWSATLPEHRGRGAQLALIGELAIQAGRRGCRHFVAETAEDRPDRPAPAHRTGLRLGFREAYRRVDWLWEAT